jgi:hypothetical protein
LPSAAVAVPVAATGSGMVALSSESRARASVFVLEEGGRPPRAQPAITLCPVSYRQKLDEVATTNPADQAMPARPCEWWSAFFLEGVGDLPRRPIVLDRWWNDGPSRAIVVDPALHTLVVPPALRFSTRDVRDLRNRKATFLLVVTAETGTKPFVLLGLVRRADGSYSETLFTPTGGEQGWAAFVHVPGEDTEISFHALDDSPALHSVCR